jgi:ABC-type lipoprotein export system ATPase subunit
MRHAVIGSSWSKWDLHFHTPSSFDYANKGVTNKEIVDNLCATGINVVAITDHHFIDVPRLRELQFFAADRLTVLPGIEFRTELGGKETVHLIGIFSEESNLEDLWTKLSGKLELTAEDVSKRGGDEKIYVDFKKAATVIHELGGVVSVHAGEKTNTIENIGNNEKFKMTLKTDLVRDFIDIYEVGKLADVTGYREKVFPTIGMELPLVIGSDNHNVKEYEVKTWCWIKADPCFRTFQQLKSDPTRAFIGTLPRELDRVSRNKTKYIDQVSFKKNSGSTLSEDWFSGSLPINSGLVAIIGNKGSGKTALAESIGLLGNCELESEFSFLNKDKFRQHKNNKAKQFSATLRWASGDKSTKLLSDSTRDDEPRLVSYIPQNYLETICNEVLNVKGSRFDLELKSVIFSHVKDEERLGAESLDELLLFKTEPIQNHLTQLREELKQLNSAIATLQQQGSSEQKQLLLNLIASKERELDSHDKIKPAEVTKPESNAAVKAKIDTISASITAKNLERNSASQGIREAEATIRGAVLRDAIARRILASVKNFEAQFNTFVSSLNKDCKEIGLNAATLVTFASDTKPVEAILQAANAESIEKEAAIVGLSSQLLILKDEVAALSEQLDAPNKEYQEYSEALRQWESKRAEIVGDENSPETITYLKKKMTGLADLPAKLTEVEGQREEKARAIFKEIESLVAVYRSLYLPVQEFIEKHPLAQDGFKLNFDARIVCGDELEQRFFEKINQGRKGSFCGSEEGKKILANLTASSDFQVEDKAIDFCAELLDYLEFDHRYSPKVGVTFADQLKNGVSKQDILDFIFGMDYLLPKYQLQWFGKDLDELSPGERGTLLLIFYLLIDKRDVPLLIDQPEENLDNQTVYKILVPCLREARERRQVIIVTHNPNLAVVCDADQVIHCEINKKNKNRVTYTSGSIENPAVNRLTIDVLEGTRPAFDHRDAKYQLPGQVTTKAAKP